MELVRCNGNNRLMRKVLKNWYKHNIVFGQMQTIMNSKFYYGAFGCKLAAYVVWFMINKHGNSIIEDLIANNLYFVGERDFEVSGEQYKVFIVNEPQELNEENLEWQLNILKSTNTKPFLKAKHLKGYLAKGEYYKMFDLETVEYKLAKNMKRHWQHMGAIVATTANQLQVLDKCYEGKIIAKLGRKQIPEGLDRKVVYVQ